MSRVDWFRGVGPMSGNTRSHAMNASRRKFNVNLQKVRVDFGSGKRTLRISAKTLKTWRKKRSNLIIAKQKLNKFSVFCLQIFQILIFFRDKVIFNYLAKLLAWNSEI